MCLKNNRSDRPVIKNAPIAEYRRSPTEGVSKRVAVAEAQGIKAGSASYWPHSGSVVRKLPPKKPAYVAGSTHVLVLNFTSLVAQQSNL